MDRHDETAAFRAHDQDCLVAASLACPVCLSGHVDRRPSSVQSVLGYKRSRHRA